MAIPGLILLFFLSATESSKILIMYPFASKSHLNTLIPVVDELATRGHQIELVMPFKDYKVNPSFKVFYTEMGQEFEDNMEEFMQGLNQFSFITDILLTGVFVEEICEVMFETTDIQAIIKHGRRYDVIIVNSIMNECAVAISPLLANHTIIANAGPISPWSYNPSHTVLPNYMLPFPPEMTFKQRCLNWLFNVLTKIIMYFDAYPRANAVVQKHYPEAPSVQKAWRDAALYLVNIDNIIMPPRLSVPRVINLPGVRCKEKKPLSKEFQTFVESSGKDGFILFSIGSLAQSRYLRSEILETFVSAFSKLKLKVIWKYEGDALKVSPNVKLSKWIPQSDLLAQDNIRLFITHGGLLGLQEAICYGVPVIGIPLFADQPSNLATIQQLGFGEILDINTFTAEELIQNINKILNDKSYRENVLKYTPILRDQIEPAAKKGADWIEYIIRYNGAKHLRSVGEDMNFFLYYSLDVITFFSAIVGIVSFLSYKLFKFLYQKFRTKKYLKNNKNKKMQ